MFEDDDGRGYSVVVNAEEQYSLWPADRLPPTGWRVRASGSMADCLAFISAVWTDLRPRSLRDQMGH